MSTALFFVQNPSPSRYKARMGIAVSLMERRVAIGEPDADWLRRFHAGDRVILAKCYRELFGTVFAVVGEVVDGTDRETVVHDLFEKLISRPEVRANFSGGSLAAWLRTLARNQAIDYTRRHSREVQFESTTAARMAPPYSDPASASEARLLLERFRRDVLPVKWAAVFEARFVLQLTQREAAARLGMHRTTLAYQEARVRGLLHKFLLRAEE